MLLSIWSKFEGCLRRCSIARMSSREIRQAKDVLARNVRVHRAIHDLSQSALADAAGTTQLTINRIEARKANPTVETLAKIAAALRVEVDALFAKPERGK